VHSDLQYLKCLLKKREKALQEIRGMTNAKVSDVLQCNNMQVGEFALRYTLGHHCKRRAKHRVRESEA
jgi:hypothetical protein